MHYKNLILEKCKRQKLMCVYCVSKVWCVSMQKCLVFNLKSKFVLFFITSCGLFLSSTCYITPAMLTYIRTNLHKEALRLLPFKLSNPIQQPYFNLFWESL